MFRNTILPIIVLIWGAALVIDLLASGPDGDGAYAGGQVAAGVFGALMVALAVRHLVRTR
jgi:hypothetical protein